MKSSNYRSRDCVNIGITIGDPSGIGPEVVIKALAKPSIRQSANFTIIGHALSCQSLMRYKECDVLDPYPQLPAKITVGKINRNSASASMAYLEKACELLKTRQIAALVTAPVSKEAISLLGKEFSGHTEFLAQVFGVENFDMMFVSKTLRTIVVTRHIPLVEVSPEITTEKIYRTILLAQQALQKFFKIPSPCIGVCGLNPHAGEGGHIGHEEIEKIIPAIRRAKKKGIRVEGPLSADTLFSPAIQHTAYDVIIAMYHDQGLIPVKTLHFPRVVNLTIGLPFVRTSPAHGTALDIAGKNKADPASMEEAIKLAVRLSSLETNG